MLRCMGICPNAYYNYLKDRKSEYRTREAVICREIEGIYHETGGILGHRSMRIFCQGRAFSSAKQRYLSI